MRVTVPYITTWSAEKPLPTKVIQCPRSGIAYADEILSDRDEHGVLWIRAASHPGRGRPQFGEVHSLRQRRAMRRLLCQVCAGPADQTTEGTLWLLRDHRDDWPGWPNGMTATEPPICLPCAHLASHACPALRKGHVTVRVGLSTLVGVYGIRYEPGPQFPSSATDDLVAFNDPAIQWTRAAQLLRELRNCTIVDLRADAPPAAPGAVGLVGIPGGGPDLAVKAGDEHVKLVGAAADDRDR
jgi:hypothetical protein